MTEDGRHRTRGLPKLDLSATSDASISSFSLINIKLLSKQDRPKEGFPELQDDDQHNHWPVINSSHWKIEPDG